MRIRASRPPRDWAPARKLCEASTKTRCMRGGLNSKFRIRHPKRSLSQIIGSWYGSVYSWICRSFWTLRLDLATGVGKKRPLRADQSPELVELRPTPGAVGGPWGRSDRRKHQD